MLCPTLDHCGPMARTWPSARSSSRCMAGESPRDPRTTPVPVERWTEAVPRGVEGLTVGVAERYFFEHTAPDIAASARRGIDALRDAGARIVEVDMQWPTKLGIADPFTPEEAATLWEFWPEHRADFGPGRGPRPRGRRADAGRRLRDHLAEPARVPGPHARVAGRGRDRPGRDAGPGVHAASHRRHRGAVRREGGVRRHLRDVRPDADLQHPRLAGDQRAVGRDDAGMPVGLQLASLPWQESYCLAAAAVVEAASIGQGPPR